MNQDSFQSELKRVKMSLANSIAVEKQIEHELKKKEEELKTWQNRVTLARASSQDELAMQAEGRIEKYRKAKQDLEIELLSQQDFTANLRNALSILERKQFAHTEDGAKALAAADTSFSSIGRMEKKVLEQEALAALGNDKTSLEFEKQDANAKLEEELNALKKAQRKPADE